MYKEIALEGVIQPKIILLHYKFLLKVLNHPSWNAWKMENFSISFNISYVEYLLQPIYRLKNTNFFTHTYKCITLSGFFYFMNKDHEKASQIEALFF